VGGLMRLMSWALVYFCVATVLALALGGAYALWQGVIDQEEMFRIAAVVHDVDLEAMKEEAEKARNPIAAEQVSFEEILRRRAIHARHVELKNQALENELKEVRNERAEVERLKNLFELQREGFEQSLAERRGTARAEGLATVRQIWENIQPKRAKEQIMQMIEADEQLDVVAILSEMPISKRAKIVSAFTEPAEIEAIDELLRLIHKGEPEASAIDEIQSQVNPTQPAETP